MSIAIATPRLALRFWALALLGSLVIAASAQIAVPLWPVPMTLQTLAVLLLGALGGSRIGVASVALYLAEGAVGLPFFANGSAGIAVLAGPTAGYLLGFLPAAWIAGQARGGWWRTGAILGAAHLVLFIPGLAWLAGFIGLERALVTGLAVFIPGTVVKTALALVAVRASRRHG
ncbi:MAG: BioY protein [Rhodospirillales bacterium]|jgi:biotin transport system substrate-specific component|nr:BioY protein [Rhodospirillales bacterium]MDB5382010.1 BioY protein [Rhodospirillales bacterium]